MEINKKIIKFNTSIRGTEKIKYIVIHDTGNVKIGADAEKVGLKSPTFLVYLLCNIN